MANMADDLFDDYIDYLVNNGYLNRIGNKTQPTPKFAELTIHVVKKAGTKVLKGRGLDYPVAVMMGIHMVRGDKVTVREEDIVEMGRVALAVYFVLLDSFRGKFDRFVGNILDPLIGDAFAAGLLETLRNGSP
ncbi:MAG: hypothetical protein JRN62_02500 [Nitrososphaerota archaeon]|jgi:hypothetical protein|nr:hypothetical protein [Nitrososphaerota archaeon]